MARLKRYHHALFAGPRADGFTLTEVLVIIAIIAILAAIMLMVNWRVNIYRAQDARRKSDLANIRRAFEEYYNDKQCYPPADVLDTCGASTLSPFLAKIPCDPVSGEPYKYVPENEANVCTGNRLCAKLQDFGDPDIRALGCDGRNGCGWGPYWNYCLATGANVTPADFNPDLPPTPTPSPTPSLFGNYACRKGTIFGGIVIIPGACNDVGDPSFFGCPYSFAESNCQNKCGTASYWCPR